MVDCLSVQSVLGSRSSGRVRGALAEVTTPIVASLLICRC